MSAMVDQCNPAFFEGTTRPRPAVTQLSQPQPVVVSWAGNSGLDLHLLSRRPHLLSPLTLNLSLCRLLLHRSPSLICPSQVSTKTNPHPPLLDLPLNRLPNHLLNHPPSHLPNHPPSHPPNCLPSRLLNCLPSRPLCHLLNHPNPLSLPIPLCPSPLILILTPAPNTTSHPDHRQ